MSAILVTKGVEASLLLTLKTGANTVTINDGTWTVSSSLRYQTERGSEPFQLTSSVSGNSVLVEMTSEQTNILKTVGTGYVLVVKLNKNDGTIRLHNTISVSVVNDL